MARTSPPGRLREVARAATRVFIAKGYRRTLMADVATEAGLSSGSMYTYVESKDALFHLALMYAMGDDAPTALEDLALPFVTPAPGETLRMVGACLAERTAFPALTAALARRAPTDVPAELTAIIEERYDAVERSRLLLALVERSALDLPDLRDRYYHRGRRSQVEDLAAYLQRRSKAGHLRPVPDAPTTGRFIIESVAWFVWHRKGDADSAMITDEQARATVRHMLTSALLP